MVLWYIIWSVTAIYVVLNFKYDIQMLQQNSYRVERYWRWLKKDNISSVWRLVDVALLLLLASSLLMPVLKALIVGIAAIVKIILIFRKKYKKPLVFTARVKRIYSVTVLLAIIPFLAVLFFYEGTDMYPREAVCLGVLLLEAIFSWAFAILAVWVLTPVEKIINQRYWNDARNRLTSVPDIKVVGITGSYGKTSTKHYLERILSEHFNVLMTPGSYNTTMGVIRTLREQLKPWHEVFICEMGAKQPGDIAEICRLASPSMGIITAVGPMHLETFKTLDRVRDTKFELADALPADGFLVLNNDFDPIAGRKVGNVETMRYAVSSNLDDCGFTATDIEYGPEGTSFTVKGPDGLSLPLKTRLVGECNISNLLGAVIIALRLGVPHDKIRYAVQSIEPVEHRLSMRRTPGGVTIIDDAFNSNPAGSKMAVELIGMFKSGRRIIVTPGMVELGAEQYNLNKEFGKNMATHTDIVLVVGKLNRQAILDGLNEEETDKKPEIIVVDSFAQAQQRLSTMLQKGDVVLYENDLPDSLE